MTIEPSEDRKRLIEKLTKVLALTSSPIEGEATAAAEHLQRLLTQHNLSIADLEKRGAAKAQVGEHAHDLGKAAFTWKLNLAEAIAEHYYCVSLVDRNRKTVAFVGRPDNVESLQLLYAWLIDQIKRIATTERRNHFIRTNEEIDPLRWQVNFGIGAVDRLSDRLTEIRSQISSEVTALVVSHSTEISDWLEATYGYRTDGRETKRQQANRERWAREDAEIKALKASCEASGDMEPYYQKRPWERPEAQEASRKRLEEVEKREERNASRRRGRSPRMRNIDWVKEEQADRARAIGREAADKVNLSPFLDGNRDDKEKPK